MANRRRLDDPDQPQVPRAEVAEAFERRPVQTQDERVAPAERPDAVRCGAHAVEPR